MRRASPFSGPAINSCWTGASICSFLIAVALLIGTFPRTLNAELGVQPQELTKILSARGKNLSALKAIMAVTSIYDAGKSRQEIRGFVLYRRPSDFRFQGVGPGGNSLFEMVVKTDSFELYVPADSKILKGGRACLSERFPDVAEMEGLIPIALLQWKDVRVMSVSDSRDATSVALAFRGGQWKALLEPKKLLLKRLDRIVAGKTDLSAEFTDFGDGEYGWLPRRFDVQSLSGGWRTIVKIDKFEINPFLVENNFKLQTSFSPKIEECK